MGNGKLVHWYIGVLGVILFTFAIIHLPFTLIHSALAECPSSDYQCQIDELQREYDARKDAHDKNKISLAEYEKQLASLNTRLKTLENNLALLEKKISGKEVDLGVQQEILAAKVHSYYVNSRKFSPFLLFLSSKNAGELVRELSFRQQAASRDRKIITSITQELTVLNSDKQTLEKSKASLAILKTQTAKQTEFMRQEVAKTESFFAQITAKQKELEALKAGGFSTSVGDVPLADDPASRPDYNPDFSPAFAVFSFGAPHRKGMSQYGAYGRAKAGQSVETILKAYYGNGIEIKKDYSTGINIRVSGYSGTVDIETYTKRIYEMPGSWGDSGGMEALKAQAVAARSYALAYTSNGASAICATESCQVYKPANKGGKWEEAVNATRGWVVMASGKPFSTMYASTSGGYILSYSSNGFSTPGFWDTTGGRGAWTDGAYEKLAGSPWFYKGWYRVRSGGTCGGRNHPWLTSSDLADILNAWHLLYKGGGDTGRIYPPDGCGGGNPYSKSELQSIGGFTDVSGVNQVVYGDGGSTLSVSLATNKGSMTINGEEFKKAFNLRAPGYIGIKSSLFNLVKK